MRSRERQQIWVDPESQCPVVLVVEDEVLVRMSVSAYLRRIGYTIVEAHSADEACKILVAGIAPDALFTDISLPGSMDGIALAKYVRFCLPNAKIIVGTAFDRLALDAKGVGQHDALLTKPYAYEKIGFTMRRLLADHVVSGAERRTLETGKPGMTLAGEDCPPPVVPPK